MVAGLIRPVEIELMEVAASVIELDKDGGGAAVEPVEPEADEIIIMRFLLSSLCRYG